ncbi:MAG: alpha/beta hydrolase domain-containing protein, partial [Acidimicrobiia bacterium]
DAVLVVFQTESEAMRAIAEHWVIPDDTDDPRFRYYELPGAGHVFSAPFGARGGSALALAERLAASDEKPEYELYDNMNKPIMWHLYDGITRWLEEGVPLPRSPRIARDPSTPDGVARDEHGNALGGLRTPWVDVPDATYIARYPGATLNAGMKRFDDEQMRMLYGSRDEYEKRVRSRLDEMVDDGWIRPEDVDLMMPTPE